MTEPDGGDAVDAKLTAYGLLEGVTVVELAHELTEYGGEILAGLGADVWLVEPPGGASTRQRRPFVEHGTPSRRSIPFVTRNAGKRSVVIDPDLPADLRRLEALLASADVVLEHQSSPLSDVSAACGRPVVRVTDPRHVGVTPVVLYAASGGLSSSGWPHQPPTNAPSWLTLDIVGTFAAILALVFVRDHRATGRVRHGDVPVTEAAIAGITNWTRALYSYGTTAAGQGAETRRTGSGAFPVFPCSDGYVRVIPARNHQWQALLELLGNPEPLADPMWTNPHFRATNYDVTFLVGAEVLPHRSAYDAFHHGQKLGLPITPVLDIPGVLTDEHVRARRAFGGVNDPDLGRVSMLRPPLRTGDERDVRRISVAPALGQDQADLPAARAEDATAEPGPSASDRSVGAPRPLVGVRVVAFGVGGVIPEAASLMALLGAEVTKIESEFGLDFFRGMGIDVTGDPNQSPTFNQANLGVQSCCVNAGMEEGRAVLRSLIAGADVVMHNMRGPVMRKFGMDYESVAAIQPDIIYMSAPGLGAGPYETYVTYGPNLHSFAGMTSVWAHPDDPFPVGSTMAYPDNHAGKQALVSVLAALVRRDRTGEGCFLECAQFEVCLWAIGDKFLQHQVRPGTVGPLGNRSLDYVPHGCFPCAGPDEWCAVAAGDDDEWARLAGLLGQDALSDPALRLLAARQARVDEIEAALAGWTSTRTPADAVAALRAAGVSASIVVDGRSQAHDREMHESGFYVAVAHPRAGVRHYTGLPFYIDGARLAVRRAPLIGEHTEHVMLDVLRLLPGELSHLVETQAVGT